MPAGSGLSRCNAGMPAISLKPWPVPYYLPIICIELPKGESGEAVLLSLRCWSETAIRSDQWLHPFLDEGAHSVAHALEMR